MSEITRTTNSIIEEAYKLIGIYSEHRALGEFRTAEGLNKLNSLLDNYSSNQTKIAYERQLTFPLTIGQQKYTFSTAIGADVSSQRIVELKFINLTLNESLYPVKIQPDVIYYRRYQDLNSTCRPTEAYFQNENESSFIYFFSKPEQVYSCTIKAKFMIPHVELSQVLDDVPAYMQEFLAYALGRSLDDVYDGSTWSAKKEARYNQLLKDVMGAADLDFNIDTGAMLKNYGGRSYGEFLSGT